MRKLVIANFKGGVGKTTLAVNLGAALARHHHRKVLLIDTDPSANMTAHFRAKPRLTLYHVLMGEAALADALVSLEAFGELYLLSSSRATQAAEFQIAPKVGRERVLAQCLKRMNGFDYVLIDTPPSISIMAQNALVYARQVLIPVSMDPMSLLGASSTIGLMKDIEDGLGVNCSAVGIVPTFVDGRLIITRVVLDAIRKQFGQVALYPVVRTDTNVRKATASQRPIVDFEKKSRAAQDFLELARVLEQQNWPRDPGDAKRTR